MVHELMESYFRLLYRNEYDGATHNLRQTALAVANDSCYTYANLVFKTESVALAVVLFTA